MSYSDAQTSFPDTDFEAAAAKLASRCAEANIGFSQELSALGKPAVRLSLPCGRDRRPFILTTLQQLQDMLSIEFEKYVMLSGLAAICRYDVGTVEAHIRFMRPLSSRIMAARLFGLDPFSDNIDEDDFRLEVVAAEKHTTLTISPPSAEMRILSGNEPFPGRLSLRIAGYQISRHDQAFELLKKLSNALFFQIEVTRGIAITLASERSVFKRGAAIRPQSEPSTLEFPKMEYDEAPITLYWYACSATGMPLLQFLAYYQAVEYYFPAFSQAESRRRIRSLIKDPTFRADRDADIARILTALRLVGGGVGDERSQLRATMLECVDPSTLREFLTEHENKEKFFSSKAEGLTDKRIPIANRDADLRNDVADRLYDIRCRIVHTKGNGATPDVEMLLPFSPQAAQLHHDIELIRFIARAVLVHASSPLRT
jgi:hypothetical protein